MKKLLFAAVIVILGTSAIPQGPKSQTLQRVSDSIEVDVPLNKIKHNLEILKQNGKI